MTMMISEVYEALRDAGVSEEKSRKAAEALTAEQHATKSDVNELKVQMLVMKWMIGLNLAGTAGLFTMMMKLLIQFH